MIARKFDSHTTHELNVDYATAQGRRDGCTFVTPALSVVRTLCSAVFGNEPRDLVVMRDLLTPSCPECRQVLAQNARRAELAAH